MARGTQLGLDKQDNRAIKTDVSLVIRPQRTNADMQGQGNYAFVCFSSAAPRGGAHTVALGNNRYALWVRSDRELYDGSPRSGHSEALLVALWNAERRGPGGAGLQPEYVFTEREPCSDECEGYCKQMVDSTWQIYFIAPYETGRDYADIRNSARWSVRNFHNTDL